LIAENETEQKLLQKLSQYLDSHSSSELEKALGGEVFAVRIKAEEKLMLALRPDQAAEALNVSSSFLWTEIKAKRIAVVRKGRGPKKIVLLTLEAIMEYLKRSDEDDANEE